MLDKSAVRLNSVDNTRANTRKYLIENKLVQKKATRKVGRKKDTRKAIKRRRARVCTVHAGTFRLSRGKSERYFWKD